VVLGLALAAPWADTAAKPGGRNSDNAKACQKGGWETLAREETPTVAFQNQDECVSYGAQGGELVAHVVLNPVVTVVMEFHTSMSCTPRVVATGFAPTTTYLFDAYLDNARITQQVNDAPVTTDGDGALSFTSTTFTKNANVFFLAVIGDVSSAWVPYLC
jgi:hypothetical protein